MKRLFLFIICMLLLPVYSALADDGDEAPIEQNGDTEGSAMAADSGEEAGSSEKGMTENDYINMDIRTSSLAELAVWCRELGLPEGGASEELASRLREYYGITDAGRVSSAAGQKVITIESAKTTEYFTIEIVDEEYARLKGDVIISLKDGNAVHRIKAWEILYNRTRNVMTASGKVEYVKEDGDTIETFKGESITVNLDNWSSIFMDGVSERSIAGNMTAYRFAGTVISRNSEEVTVLTSADITNPANEEAFWSLHASKLWLLPGNDFALFNAVLKVGNIPLFWFPFFYYPADEIIFHPVLGFRSREGTFLQTTTYILGRPKTSVISENSITKIFGGASDNMEQKREGVFLRNTGEKRVDPTEASLSVLFDAYVNLGVYLGMELSLPRKGVFGETSFSAGVGRTRDIYPYPGGLGSTPFAKYDGVSDWNSAKFFSLEQPLRYRMKAGGSFQIKNGSFSWELPFYSDPYVDRDFMRREELKDWLTQVMDYVKGEGEDEDITDNYLSSYEWRLNGSFTIPVSALSPYLSSFSISSISSSMLFGSRDSISYTGPYTPPNPGRLFFFPSRLTIYSFGASAAGTPFTLGSNSPGQPSDQTGTETAPGDSLLPDLPRSPWDTETIAEEQNIPDAGDALPSELYTFTPPVLNQRFSLPTGGGPRLSVDYRLSPSSASELQFNSNPWREQDDIDWGDMSSILTRFRSDGNVGMNLNHSGGNAYSASFRLSGTGSWQDYMFMNEDAEEFNTVSKVTNARNRAYNETYFTSSWDASGTVRPFFQSSVWGNSSLQYTVRGLLAKTTVDTSGSDPEWEWVKGKWDKTDIQTHQVAANVAANIMDNNQSLTLTTVLPPKDSSASGNATFRAWISETSARGSVQFPMDEEKRKWDPFYLTETLRFGTIGSFRQYVVYDPEMEEYTTFTSDLSLLGFTASYSAVYTQPYRYNYSGSVDPSKPDGWLLAGDRGLVPREFRLGYVNTFAKKETEGKLFSFSVNVNTSLAFDLQRYTNSRLSFGLGFNMGIANFLDLSLSTSSENGVVFKYFQNWPFFDMPTELYQGQETNFFRDLVNSFRFDKEELRRKSGFKLKSLDLSLIHHLGDWNAKLSIYMTPYLDTATFPYSYKFSNEISFLIQWVPIGEIKTQIDYSKEVLTIK